MEPTITGAMLQRAKGPELVSHLKARASATNLSPPLLTSDAPYKHGAARPLDGAEVRVGVGVRARARAPMCHPHPKSITGPPSPPSAGPPRLSHAVPAPRAPQKLSEELEEWEQTEEQESLKAVAAVLGSAKLLRHRDGDVKLLTACCLSDVLRIFAPESPYENDTLKMVPLP